jgi:hypothetical protein
MRSSSGRFIGRRLTSRGLVVAAAGLMLLLTAEPALAVGTGSYTITHRTGATFVQLSSSNLVTTTSDDVLYYLSTTGTGLARLPFPLHLYNQVYTKAAISSNGNIQPGITSPQGVFGFTNDCLSSPTFGRSAVLPFWDDLYFDVSHTSNGYTEGIFLRTTGTAPHRTFLVSWQGEFFQNPTSQILAQVTFSEGSQNVVYVYGRSGGGSATIGIQAKQLLSSTQYTCNSGSATAVTSGLKLTLTHH